VSRKTSIAIVSTGTAFWLPRVSPIASDFPHQAPDRPLAKAQKAIFSLFTLFCSVGEGAQPQRSQSSLPATQPYWFATISAPAAASLNQSTHRRLVPLTVLASTTSP
jgi:hypothetical protein